MNSECIDNGMSLANWLKFLHLAFQSLRSAIGKVQPLTLVQTIELNTSSEEQGLPLRERQHTDSDDFISVAHVKESLESLG